MKITRIIIKKFRSIDKADVWSGSINAIVGQNNSGKSCLLRALNAFFNYEKEEAYFSRGAHSFSPRAVAKIELHFEEYDASKIPNKYINNGKIIIETSFRINTKGCARSIRYKSGSSWVTDPQVIDEVKKQIEFILIPPNRDAGALELLENNILQLLVEEKMKEATEARDNYTVKFKAAIDYLENKALKKIADDAKAEFPVNKSFGIKINYQRSISYKDFLPDVGISIDEAGLCHPLVECGSGIQSLTVISLYNLLGKARDENILLGLEEPETNLHPQAQKELIDYFKALVHDGSVLQFFFTTHSSNMIDQVDHTEIILFKKVPDEARGFISVLKRLPKDFFEKYELNDFKYYQFYRYRNSDFFFSSFIVVTESKNEVEIIKRIGKKSGFDYETNGLSYLNLEGVDKAKYTVYLLKELDIPFLLIVDKDFFVPYGDGEFDSSLDHKGFPVYKTEFKNIDLVKTLINDHKGREKLLSCINSNHNRMLNILEDHNVISMRYSLDLDLVGTQKGQEKYYHLLNIPAPDRNTATLTSKRKAIKKIARVIEVFECLDTNNWPHSYSRIRKILGKITKELGKA